MTKHIGFSEVWLEATHSYIDQELLCTLDVALSTGHSPLCLKKIPRVTTETKL
jgi:hypothetical protein